MSLDVFFKKRYDVNHYNCSHFVGDVYKFLTGRDITQGLSCFMKDRKSRFASIAIKNFFKRIDTPQDPCIVLMHRPKFAPHVGVFTKGKIIHITQKNVEFVNISVATRGFTIIRYYDVA
jgi:hypothetical protein